MYQSMCKFWWGEGSGEENSRRIEDLEVVRDRPRVFFDWEKTEGVLRHDEEGTPCCSSKQHPMLKRSMPLSGSGVKSQAHTWWRRLDQEMAQKRILRLCAAEFGITVDGSVTRRCRSVDRVLSLLLFGTIHPKGRFGAFLL